MRLVKSARGSAFTTLLILGLAACGESPVAPLAESTLLPEASDPLMAGYGGADIGDVSDSHRGDARSGSRKFTVSPNKPVLKNLGDHVLSIPANVICDPATSRYGVRYWDAPCRTIDRPIEVSAQWATVNGHEVIRFTPELRFAPSTDRRRWVILSVKHGKNIDPTKRYSILWRNPETNQWIDEAAKDPTLRVQLDRHGKIVSRRLKHFSDYLLWVGLGSYNVISGIGGAEIDWGGW
jgi:hypothetical protein